MKTLAVSLSLLASIGGAMAQDNRPNIILLLTDDQTTESYQYMPFLQSIRPLGRTFDQYYQSYALCVPSRASMLTGMYPHNHQTMDPHTGYSEFASGGHMARTWGKVLRDRGYYTAVVGKFMNGYQETTVPEGWDEWFVMQYEEGLG